MTHDPLSLTRKLLAFNTINPPGNERDCAEFLGGLLENAGFDARYYEFADKRAMLIGRLVGGGDKLPIPFYGSFGYGPLGATAWRQDAFAGEIDGDKLYGRSTSDMKKRCSNDCAYGASPGDNS